jgi:RND superfamily putative drug exporter
MDTPATNITGRIAVTVARHPVRALVAWGVLLLAALAFAATSLHGLNSTGYVVGKPQSEVAARLYERVLAGRAEQQPTDVVIVSSTGETVTSPNVRSAVDDMTTRLRALPGITAVQSDLRPGSPMVSPDGHATVIPFRAASDNAVAAVETAVRAADGKQGVAVAATGQHITAHDVNALAASDLSRGELHFGLPVAIVVLFLVFGTVVAGLMPVAMALLTIAVGLGIATGLAQAFSLSVFIVNMMTGMGLALGIDYALIIISRYREERARGVAEHSAIAITGSTASRAVAVSGGTFVVALLGMLLVPTNVMRSLAAGAIIVGLVSVAAALTLLPAVLSLLGDRIDAVRIPLIGRRGALGGSGTGPSESKLWRAAVTAVLRHPRRGLALSGGLMLLAAVPAIGLHLGQSGVSTLPDSTAAKQGYRAVAMQFPTANPNLVNIVVNGGSGTDREDLQRLQAQLAADPRFGTGSIEASPRGDVLALTTPLQGDPNSGPDVAAIRDLRQHVIPATFSGSRTNVYVGGTTAQTADYLHAVGTPTPYVLTFVLGLSLVILTVAFRSLAIAVVSILLNLLSVGAAYGLLTLVFEHGVGASLFGFQRVTAIDAWVPLFLFSVLFALSMDYQVFLMSRIKERFDAIGDTTEAVASGIASTAKLITGAALIIVVVFSGFARGQLVMFQQMGFGVAIALLLDAFVIRTVALPSTLQLLGRRSWYLPRWLRWLPHVEAEGHQPAPKLPAGVPG